MQKLTSVIAITLLLLGLSSSAFAQSEEIREALAAYKNEQHSVVLELLAEVDHPEARILKGKSLYAMGNFQQALRMLARQDEVISPNLLDDANYTKALSYIQLRNYGAALQLLKSVKIQTRDKDLFRTASELYDQVLAFLSLEQRLEIFKSTASDELKLDVIRAAIPYVSPTMGTILVKSLKAAMGSALNPLDEQQLNAMLASRTFVRKEHEQVGPAPYGFSYQLGLALPAVPTTDPDYEIFQALYFGSLLAVEEFNQRNTTRKAYLNFKKTAQSLEDGALVADLAWNHSIDAIIGPIMSSSASVMAPVAEHYQIPMLAPLANIDTLNIDNPYFFQLNPTFSVLGTQMAQFAIKHLRFDTLAVIADYKDQDIEAAVAFRNEVERLGGHIAYFLTEDFEAVNYDIAKLTKYFVGDEVIRDSLGYKRVDAVFVPFASSAANILMDLMLTDLEALRSDVAILGTAHLNELEVDPARMDNFKFYLVDVFNPKQDADQWLFFNSDYELRFEVSPNRFSYIGYDATQFLISTLEKVHNPVLLKNALRTQPKFQGLGNAIHFKGTHRNQAVEFYELTSKEKRLIRVRF